MLGINHFVRTSVSKVVNARLRFERHLGGRVVTGRDVEGLHHVTFEGRNAVGRGTVFAGEVSIGMATTVGANCYLNGPVAIGNYCQLGPAVGIYGKNHPTQYMTSYINHHLIRGRMSELSKMDPVDIGHDVWFGHGAIVLPGVHIGNGAVVGAGAVVTRDIPPFSVVVGNPAKVIRLRFSEVVVSEIERLSWWTYGAEILEKIAFVFSVDMDREPERALASITRAHQILIANAESHVAAK